MSSGIISFPISGKVSYVGQDAFLACDLHNCITFDNTCYVRADDCLILSVSGSVLFGTVQHVSVIAVPDSVHFLSDACLGGCSFPWRVIFRASSSLSRIGSRTFTGTRMDDMTIPGMGDIGRCCLENCRSLLSVSLCEPSLMEFIDYGAFQSTKIQIPGGTRRVGHSCFRSCNHYHALLLLTLRWTGSAQASRCRHLGRVVFGSASVLERIGIRAFSRTNVTELVPPNRLEPFDPLDSWCCRPSL